jgi:hypothetical protein
MRKRSGNGATEIAYCRNDKALKNQGFVGTNMAEAMSLVLMFIDFHRCSIWYEKQF